MEPNPVYLTREHLANHSIVVGKTGTGKSTLLENVAISRIEDDEPCSIIVIDPLGSTAEKLIDVIPPHRIKDTCYFKLTDSEYSIGFNPFAGAKSHERYVRAQDTKQSLHDIFYDSWGERLDWLAYNCIRLAIETDNDFAIIQHIVNKKALREKLIAKIRDERLLDFWASEFPSYSPKYLDEAKGPLLNKVGQFMASPHVYNSMRQKTPKLHLEKFINERRILIVNLDAARLGTKTAHLFGSLLVSRISSIGMARDPSVTNMPLFLFVDEWQNLGTTVFARGASQWRQFDLHLFLANQFLSQINEAVLHAVLGNMGTIISFAVGPRDADALAKYFGTSASQLVDMPKHHARFRLNPTIDSFRYRTEPFTSHYQGSREAVIKQSHERFGRKFSRIA